MGCCSLWLPRKSCFSLIRFISKEREEEGGFGNIYIKQKQTQIFWDFFMFLTLFLIIYLIPFGDPLVHHCVVKYAISVIQLWTYYRGGLGSFERQRETLIMLFLILEYYISTYKILRGYVTLHLQLYKNIFFCLHLCVFFFCLSSLHLNVFFDNNDLFV